MNETCSHPKNERTSRIAHGFLGDAPAGTVQHLCGGCGADVTEDVEWEQYAEDAQNMCECEQDWNCHLHQNRQGTFVETRYAGLDD